MNNHQFTLNADIGESFGRYSFGNDTKIISLVDDLNIACGYHAGDYNAIVNAVQSTIEQNKNVGAHPSFPDIQGFGRRYMNIPIDELKNLILLQVATIHGLCDTFNTKIHHIKPHGALYHEMTKNKEVLNVFIDVIKIFKKEIKLYGFSNQKINAYVTNAGLHYVNEVFADRRYSKNGMLVARTQQNAVISDINEVYDQVSMIIEDQKVMTVENEKIDIQADTICVHGDTPNSLEIAKCLHTKFR